MSALINRWTLSKGGYYVDLIIFPVTAFVLLLCSGGRPVARASFFVAGALLWSSIEYVVHRHIFHRKPLSDLHDQHHAFPAAYIGVPSAYTVPAFAAATLYFVWLFGAPYGLAFSAGLLAWYSWYIVVHDIYHHGSAELTDALRLGGMKRRHNAHHRGGHYNFGVSSPLWDLVLGTYKA